VKPNVDAALRHAIASLTFARMSDNHKFRLGISTLRILPLFVIQLAKAFRYSVVLFRLEFITIGKQTRVFLEESNGKSCTARGHRARGD
jgi:hypothetical protein